MRVEMPDGGWAELRPPSDLVADDEYKVRDAVELTTDPEAEQGRRVHSTAGGTTAMEMAMLAQVITAWSRPEPPSLPAVRKLPLAWFRKLKKEIEPHMAELRDDPNPGGGSGTATASTGA